MRRLAAATAVATALLAAGCSSATSSHPAAAAAGDAAQPASQEDPRVDAPGEIYTSSGIGGTSIPVTSSTSLDSSVIQSVWWTWAMTTSSGRVNALKDPDGEACADGQPKGVWLLAGTLGGHATRSCAVPGNRVLVFPLVGLTASSELDCENQMTVATGGASLDSAPLSPTTVYGERITWYGSAGSPYPGTHVTWACGLWVAVPPLGAGVHHLSFRGAADTFSTSADYTLTVAS
jgi:hypothetical protein